ncbi:MAG: hypothetical protein EHM42_03795, partial [Planctomycetaceae bacterium]
MSTIFIPPAWRDLTGGVEQVESDSATVRQVLNSLEQRYPGIRARAIADDGLRPGLSVAINGTVSRMGLIQKIPPGAEVHFLPALGG